jgi:hypothetical protein
MNFSACRSCPARAQIGNQIWQTPPIPVVPDRLCRSVSADQRSWPSEVHSKVWLPPLGSVREVLQKPLVRMVMVCG